ncbi:hypothetical protein P3T23_002484 [Paraburkholderia sp. GAS448]
MRQPGHASSPDATHDVIPFHLFAFEGAVELSGMHNIGRRGESGLRTNAQATIGEGARDGRHCKFNEPARETRHRGIRIQVSQRHGPASAVFTIDAPAQADTRRLERGTAGSMLDDSRNAFRSLIPNVGIVAPAKPPIGATLMGELNISGDLNFHEAAGVVPSSQDNRTYATNKSTIGIASATSTVPIKKLPSEKSARIRAQRNASNNRPSMPTYVPDTSRPKVALCWP